ncbi:MAG: CoB--CoM heterodisulfide reductase iron-sulfur subunit B family protein [Chloroflexi bacterium]|nr:CoB--CoM heterodisulfide reductase iron-sulfur subunit B family protein [Chloroflexota bacterium]
MNYGYYPGCSLERNAAAYDVSTRAVAAHLGLGLDELEDWNCCGATEYIAINKLAAYALIGRNLALAQKQLHAPGNGRLAADGRAQLVAPCSACFLNLRKADRYLQDDETLRTATNEALAAGGLHYDPGTIFVRHLLDVMVNDVGFEEIKRRVTKPLAGLRVAPYYGCLLVRPRIGGELSNAEYPTELDQLMKALGAEVVDFPLKAHCCGGHMTQISAEVAYELLRRLLQNAADYKADVIVTLCPMCQLNLDAYQSRVNQHFGAGFNLPILYFTQMMGLAFGLDEKALGFGKEIVSAAAALAKIGEPPKAEAPARRQKDDKALPMPGAKP